jgi:hypothetical protein
MVQRAGNKFHCREPTNLFIGEAISKHMRPRAPYEIRCAEELESLVREVIAQPPEVIEGMKTMFSK